MNVKKLSTIAIALCLSITTIAQKTKTPAKSVEINGVTWATCNVDTPGTFTSTPESLGMYYQWNKNIGWSSTEPAAGVAIENWNTSAPESNKWEKANDPCPIGFRVPTRNEIGSLTDKRVTNERLTQNGVNGVKFTDKKSGNSVFFPVAGYRNKYNGMLDGVNARGFYWSSTLDEEFDDFAYYLFLNNIMTGPFKGTLSYAHSVRCVKE